MKNKNENNRYQLLWTRGEETERWATRWNARFVSKRGERGGRTCFHARKIVPVDRSICRSEFDLPRDPAPLQHLPPLSRLIKRDSSMYSFMGRAFLSCWYAGRRKKEDRFLSFFFFKIFAKDLKLIFFLTLSLEMKGWKGVWFTLRIQKWNNR